MNISNMFSSLGRDSASFFPFSMVIEEEYRVGPLSEWIGFAALKWIVAMGVLLLLALLLGTVISFLRHGPFGTFPALLRGTKRAMEDILLISPARTWAIARLVIQDSIRKRVVIICLVFILILMFAGWYLNPNTDDPARLYVSFVMNATCYLTLFLVLFLSAFSLPSDFKSKTVYTIVTKPVRASEMVFGRILGIGIVGSAILIFMACASYLFVSFSLNHTHIVTQQVDLSPAAPDPGLDPDSPRQIVFKGKTRLSNSHQHDIEVLHSGDVIVKELNNHTHHITSEERDGKTIYTVEPAQGLLQARVPVYGKIMFRGAGGIDEREGINVGDEWFYRSFIGNGSAAFWSFEGVTKNRFPLDDPINRDGLPVEMTLGLFRTHKGDMEQTLLAKLSVRNPRTGLTGEAVVFNTQEFVTLAVNIPWQIDGKSVHLDQRRTRNSSTGNIDITPETLDDSLLHKDRYDLFEDFVDDGKMEIWLECLDSQQYIGIAEYDLYIRAGEAPVLPNFLKGYFGIWQQMVMLLCYGVLLSSFLSGPVSMVSTLGVMIAGFCKPFLLKVGLGSMGMGQEGILGGGPFESFWRILTGTNMMSDLPPTFATTFVKSLDAVVGAFMALIGQAIPPLWQFSQYNVALSSGFDVPFAWILQHGIMTLAYFLPMFIIGYLILSNREVAK